jgi:photosystem II stability/assembly factor-like uncharacterized protein
VASLPRSAANTAALSTSTWTSIGPAPLKASINSPVVLSGRITGIAAHPFSAGTIYIAAAGGGVWMTTDAGSNWTPLTDSQRTLSMGAIAIAASNPLVIYAGTGEANNSFDSNFGRGILVSTDGGATWTLRTGPSGIFDRMASAAIAVDPTNENIAYAAMATAGENGLLGRPGIYKTTDGGVTWINTTSAITTAQPYTDVQIDLNAPATVYMAVGRFSGSALNGVYKSVNGGGFWTLLSNGPTGTSAGRIAIAVSKSNSQVLYVAAVQSSGSFGLYKMMRSNDGGATFTDLTSGTPNFPANQGPYDIYVAVDPTNSSIVYAAGSAGANSMIRSTNSGQTWADISVGGFLNLVSPHADHHAVAFDANGRLLDGDDGGIFRLDDPVLPSWSDLNGNLGTIHFMSVGLHPTNPNEAIGGSQDNGTSVYSGNVEWTRSDGGDGGFAKFSSTNGSRVYHVAPVGSFGSLNFFRRSDNDGASWTSKTTGLVNTAEFNFYPPFVVDPNNGDRVLLGGDRVYETTTAADTWTQLSAPGSNGWTSIFGIDALPLSKSDPNTIYAAVFPDLFVTTNHGATWTYHPLPLLGFIGDIQVDPMISTTAYVVFSNFSSGGVIFKTINGGLTWTNITGNLPNLPLWSLQVDPAGALYVGADDGVYNSNNGGSSWSRFGAGLPNAQVFQIELNTTLNLLAAATHGRGVWEITTPQIVSQAPDLTISKTHSGSLVTGQTGASYTLTVRNMGTGLTSNTVTVTDNLPGVLTATSIGGGGWNCSQPSGPCTRNDALAPGASYPPITMTVNISGGAFGSVANTATVSGGGEVNTGNDMATDTAVLLSGLAPPVLTFPADGAAGTSLTPTLTWNAASGATSYDVYFGLFSPPPFVMNTASLSYALQTLNPNTTYYWQIAARNSTGLSPASAVRFFMTGPSNFIPVTPCRIADTRNANGPFGGPALVAQTSRDFAIPSSACNIPANATAYSLNIAVAPRGRLGYLTAYPSGQAAPLVAILNSIDGRIKSNAAIVPAGTNGAISIFTTDSTDVVIDINGYFVPNNSGTGLAFYPLTPCRIADTRNPAGPLGGPRFAAGSVRTFPVLSSNCNIPATAQAYALNFAAVPSGPLGFLTAWPTGQPQPFVASLNAPTGAVTANAVIVGAGASGSVDVFALSATDLVIDITGYFAPPGVGGLSLYNVAPCRVLDTRLPAGSLPFTGTRDVNVAASPCSVPAAAQAYVFSATVVPPGPLGFLTMWPQGQPQPPTAMLNAGDGAVTSNMAVIPTVNGSVSAFALNSTHLVLDIFGYFAP